MDHNGLPMQEFPTFITPYVRRFSELNEACSRIDLHKVQHLFNSQSITNINERIGQSKLTALHVCLGNLPSRYMDGRFQTVPNGFNFIHLGRIIDLLLKNGADPLAINNQGETPLHFSVRYSSHFPFLQKILQIFPGLNVNCKDFHGRTVLYWSCYKGLQSISELLLQHGADVRTCTNRGFTVLHMPISPEDVDFFVYRGANLNAQALSGFTPLHEAVHMIYTMYTGRNEEHDFLLARLRAILSHFPSLTLRNNSRFTAEQMNLPRYATYRDVREVFDQHHNNVHDRKIAIAMSTHPRLGDNSELGVLGPDILGLVDRYRGHAN